MKKNAEDSQTERLSSCLDQLNNGQYPMITDKEIEELIEVAAIVKQAHAQEEVPRVLIDSIVTNLALELGTEREKPKPKQRKKWFYSSLAAAAAVIILVMTNQVFLPQFSSKNIAQEMDNNTETKKIAALPEKNMTSSLPTQAIGIGIKPPQPISSEEKVVAIAENPVRSAPVHSIPQVFDQVFGDKSPVVKEEKNNQIAMLEKKAPQEIVMFNKQVMAKRAMLSPQAEKEQPSKLENSMLIRPDVVAQVVTVVANGGIQQIYNKGAQDQLIITQWVTADLEKQELPTIPGQETDKNKEYHQQFLLVKIGQYSVQLEGNTTKENLQKIADSLVLKKQSSKEQ